MANSEDHEIIVDKIRRASICGDTDRKTNSLLLDKMATLAEQVALVARMGEEEEENEENNYQNKRNKQKNNNDDNDDDIDDSEHYLDNSFALKADSHHLDGREAFSFDQAFDEEKDQNNSKPFQIGTLFEFMNMDEDGILHLNKESFKKLENHLEQLHIVGVFDFTLNTSPQTLPLYFSKLSSLQNTTLQNIEIPNNDLNQEKDTEGTIFGMWGPPLHPPNNHSLNSTQSSGRVLYLILKCQSLFQTMNTAVIQSNENNLTNEIKEEKELKEAKEIIQLSQCTLKCATIISLLSHSLVLFIDIPTSNPLTAPSSHYIVQQQSSQIVSLFMKSLSESCQELIKINQSIDETLKRKANFPPSLCVIREFTSDMFEIYQLSPKLTNLFSSIIQTQLNYFDHTALYFNDVCLDFPVTTTIEKKNGENSIDSALSYEQYINILNNLLYAYSSHILPSLNNDNGDNGDNSENINQKDEKNIGYTITNWNGPYVLEILQPYISYVELQYKDSNCVPQSILKSLENNDDIDGISNGENNIVITNDDDNSILEKYIEQYKGFMIQYLRDPLITEVTESLLIENLENKSNENIENNNEVDSKFTETLNNYHKQIYDKILLEFDSFYSNQPNLKNKLQSAILDEKKKYENHSYQRSKNYNEILLQSIFQEFFNHSSNLESQPQKEQKQEQEQEQDKEKENEKEQQQHTNLNNSDNDQVINTNTNISIVKNVIKFDITPIQLSEILEIYNSRARGPAKREVISSYLTKYYENSVNPIKLENDQLKLQVHQYHSNQLKLRSKLEELATENSLLHRTVEEKTDKALDAWAALHEKYSALEKSLQQSQNDNKMKDEYINKLRIHITQIEKMNAAMKYGVNKLLEEEDLKLNSSNQSNNTINQQSSGSSFIDMLSFALACATGSPLDDDSSVYKGNSHRSNMSNSDSTGFHWETSLSNQISSSSSNLKQNNRGQEESTE